MHIVFAAISITKIVHAYGCYGHNLGYPKSTSPYAANILRSFCIKRDSLVTLVPPLFCSGEILIYKFIKLLAQIQQSFPVEVFDILADLKGDLPLQRIYFIP